MTGPTSLLEGGSFAAYEVQHRLAVGGMGEVYLCRHRVLNRLDAVKVLRPHLAADKAFRSRFLREAMSIARVRHPSVVTLYTADEADGLLYLAMEYLPGDDLGDLLRREGRLTADRAVALLRQVADALDTAHRAQLVHRDVKPSNLIVGASGDSVTLVDFGISRMLDDDSEITRTGEIVGTIAYASPEQLTRRPVTGACDQYSLACVAYECLTGGVPFPRDGQLAIMTAHVASPPPRATTVRPDLPVAVDAVLARGMAKDPAARFVTCTEFVEALAAAVTGDGGARRDPVFVDAAALADGVRRGTAAPRRPGALSLRVGWGSAAPLVVDLGDGPLAVRAEPGAAAGTVRWLLAQAVSTHPTRELCVVGALAPVPDESWLWLNWLPHARPGVPPLAGPHVATTTEAAADLWQRLALVVSDRVARAATGARVLAVLDGRLGARAVDFADTARVGVHAVLVLPPDAPTPYGMSTLDIAADGVRCRLVRAGAPPVDGGAEAVSAGYVRDLANLLPDA